MGKGALGHIKRSNEDLDRFLPFPSGVRLSILYTGKDLAEHYAKFRPTYNTKLFETIVEFYESDKGRNCNYDLAVDVGCGPGQSTLPLANYFSRVIGVDVSKDQLSQAPKDVDRVEFQMGTGENLNFLRDGSVDLVTAASACHWFDYRKFYYEVERVLKPGGVLAVYGYRFEVIENDLGKEVYLEYLNMLQDYQILNFSNIEELYGHMQLPFAVRQRIENNTGIDMIREVSVSEFVGFLLSIYDWWLYRKDNPHGDELQKLQTKLGEIYREDKLKMKIKFHVVMMLGKKPL